MRAFSRCFARLAALLAALTICGGHWAVLQSVAWTNMLVTYSQHERLGDAIAKTFDGDHPCSLCHAVNAGKKSEKKTDRQVLAAKIEMIAPSSFTKICPPSVQDRQFFSRAFVIEQRSIAPPSPPPRELLS
jgi:hypothetical protein